jgi:DNA-binding CsgD family transcriptional regulator
VFRILNVHNRTQAVFEVSRLRLRLPGADSQS